MKFYAGIGSRETPIVIQELMYRIAVRLAADGWTLRSGHADGADLAFETGAAFAQGTAEIYLPWSTYNDADQMAALEDWQFPPICLEHELIAKFFHPNWEACGAGARLLHSRNTGIVLGPTPGSSPVSSFVICWTKDGKASGGTGQGIRVAEHYGIPVFNLHDPAARARLETWLSP